MINKNTLKLNYYYIIVLLFSVLTLGKQLIYDNMFNNLLSITNICFCFSIYLLIYTISFLISEKRIKLFYIILIYNIFNLLYFFDLIHFRFFSVPISKFSIYQMGEAVGVADNIISLLRLSDIMLFIDCIIIIIFTIFFRRVIIKKYINNYNKKIIATFFITISIAIFILSSGVNKYNDILSHHLFDLMISNAFSVQDNMSMEDYQKIRNNKYF